MKNRLYILITIVLAAFMCFTSCKSEVDKADTKKISISVEFPSLDKIDSNTSLKSEAELNARKAYLTEEEVANIINSYTFTLMAKKLESEGGEPSELEAKTVLSGFSYAELQKATFDIQAGPWLFTLYAYGQETGEICLSATDSATITSESVQLEFEMKYVEGALGIFKFTVPLSYTYEEELGAIPGYYHKIVIRSLDSPDKDYLVYEYNKNDDRVSTLFKTDTSGTSEKSYCTYSVKLEVGKYIAFVYDVKNSNPASGVLAYKTYPFNNGGEIVYIYGGVTTSKEYLTSYDGTSAQIVDVELYIGKNRDEEITKNNCWGDFPGTKYDYDAKSGCLTFKNTFTLDNFYLPKLCFADEYLVGWYTDKECTKKADYLNYIDCSGQADRLGDVKYFIYDLTKVAGTLKLYAKFAPRYDILIETFGATLDYDKPLKSFNEELVEPEDGSTIWTLKNCAYEMPISRFNTEMYGDDGKKSAVFIRWYLDEDLTEVAPTTLNLDLTGKDSVGNPLKIYPYFIDENAVMYVKIMDEETEISDEISCDSEGNRQYKETIQIDASGRFDVWIRNSAIPPAKNGYAFTGWYSDPDFENPLTYNSTYGEYSYNFEGLDNFIPGGTIYIYAKYEPLVIPSLNISVQSYEKNDLELIYTENNGVLTVTASPITTGTTYESYTWLVNGSILPEENSNTLNYTLYTNEGGSQTPVYTSSSTIFISCIAKRDSDNDDSDDASLELLLDIKAEIEVVYEGTEDVEELIFQIQYCKGSLISDDAKQITVQEYNEFDSGIPIEGLSAGKWTFRITGKRQTECDDELQDYLYEDVIQGYVTEQLDYGNNTITIRLLDL
ncbi:MAG: hypothetical protein IKN54_06275 [Lachnospiraceae bacterium]|nr:hypothetical protein [Lachnospiraceae bacterium]